MEAANADVTMYEEMIAQTETMKPLELVGGTVKGNVKSALQRCAWDTGGCGGLTEQPRGSS